MKNISTRNDERGIIILIVAVVLLFVVGGMAALSIDVVTFYTARSEAQLAADGAALAGARALANSGMTSDPSAVTDGVRDSAWTLAQSVASRVAMSNEVGGRTLTAGEVTVTATPSIGDASFLTNPRVEVTVARSDIPTFFARIWGNTTVRVQASATAEAYNPSGVNALGGTFIPVAPTCVKPWVLPNISPIDGTSPIVNSTTGAILATSLVTTDISGTPLQPICARGGGPGGCNSANFFPSTTPTTWNFYPGDQSSFPAPAVVPSCVTSGTAYEQSVAGCVEAPIACGSRVTLDSGALGPFHRRTADATNCLTHATNDAGDSIDTASRPVNGLPYQFLTGEDNPMVSAGTIAQATDVTVSDSIVTVPIFDQSSLPSTTATVIGFVQLFLNSDGFHTDRNGVNSAQIKTEVINVVGCDTGASVQPILGNGSSPVAVRLITP